MVAAISPQATAQLSPMRTLVLAAALLLAACGTYCPTDMHGLDPPPPGSTIPAPHG